MLGPCSIPRVMRPHHPHPLPPTSTATLTATHCPPPQVVGNIPEYCASINPTAAAVALAKRLVLDAKKADISRCRRVGVGGP